VNANLGPALFVAALVAVLVAGYSLGSQRERSSSKAAPEAAAEAAAPAVAPAASAEPQAASFWQLNAEAREAAGTDTARQSELLEERLSELSGKQILDFEHTRHEMDRRAYTWDLWGAAYVIEDGCSDDCFRDFRAYLISLGPDSYEAALRDPDSLADVVEDAEEGDWENADDVAPDAYEAATGKDFPDDGSDLSGDPSGEPWDDEDQDALVQRYPRLAERFR
jgi:hypothetical protein